MFCNHCGKTLNSEADTCPSCGAAVGESRFEGSGYTAAQSRFVPEEGSGENRYAPYTRTTYTSMGEEEQQTDVYARTSYRPVLAEDEGASTTGQIKEDEGREEAEAVAEGGSAEEIPPQPEAEPQPIAIQPEAEPDAGDAGKEEKSEEAQPLTEDETKELDALGIVIKPLEPIKKTGISPEVEKYIQRMNEQKAGRRSRRKDREDAPEREIAQTDAVAENATSSAEEADDEQTEVNCSTGGAVRKWVMRGVAALCVFILIGVGVLWLAQITAERAPIEGVSLDLYNNGVALMQERVTDEYRAGILKLWRADQTGAAAQAQLAEDRAAISALMPQENALENDKAFVETMLSIQDSVDTATTMDAIAASNADEGTGAVLSAESDAQWAVIKNAVTRLANSTGVEDLTAIRTDAAIESVQTIEPPATPTPSPYTTLKKGMKNSAAVKKLQYRLYQLGFFNGDRDGDYGAVTQTAVKRFQEVAGWSEVDGIATAELQELLFSDQAPDKNGNIAATPAPDTDAGANADASSAEQDATAD